MMSTRKTLLKRSRARTVTMYSSSTEKGAMISGHELRGGKSFNL